MDVPLPRGRPATPTTQAAVWHAITSAHGNDALDGESGLISFGGEVDRQVPLDELISIQHVDGTGRPRQLGFCGRYGDVRRLPWCPALEAEKAGCPGTGPACPAQ